MREERDYCRRTWVDAYALGSGADPRFVLPKTQPRYTPDRSFASVHIRLELRVDFKARSLQGRCTSTLRSLHDGAREIIFDAVLFKVRSVWVSGRRARFRHDGKKLKIQIPAACAAGSLVKVDVAYTVRRPPAGLFFVAADRRHGRPDQLWTQGQDEYSRYWFPCLDAPEEKATTELIAHVPRGFVAVSNGRLISRKRQGNQEIPG